MYLLCCQFHSVAVLTYFTLNVDFVKLSQQLITRLELFLLKHYINLEPAGVDLPSTSK